MTHNGMTHDLDGRRCGPHRGAISAKGKRRSPCLARAWMGFIPGKFTTRGTDSGSRRRVDFGVSAGNLRCAAKFSHPRPHSPWNVDRGSSSSKPPKLHRYAHYRWLRAGIPGGRTPGSNRAPSWLRPGKEVGADLARELRRALAPLDCLNPQKLAPHLYSQTKVRSS
jgi:hypothetical protein